MILIVISSMVFIYFTFTDLIPVYKKEEPKVFWMYLTLFILSYGLTLLILLDIKLPSPATPIKQIIISIFGEGV